MNSDEPERFRISPRQRRLRVFTLCILVTLLAMIGFGVMHPFFRSPASPNVAARVRQELAESRRSRETGASRRPPSPERRAVSVRLLLIYLYWLTCILLTSTLFVMAWLDVRETRLEVARVRGAIWRAAADESARRKAERDSGKGA